MSVLNFTGAVLLATLAIAIAAGPPAAQADPTLRACGRIDGWSVHRDPVTTTCALARSALRDFLHKLGQGAGEPRRITGYSEKTGRSYRLTRTSTVRTRRGIASVFTGRAGAATLRVRIASTLF